LQEPALSPDIGSHAFCGWSASVLTLHCQRQSWGRLH